RSGNGGKVRGFFQGGSTRVLDELGARIPEGVRALLAVPGLGPRTLGRLYRELGVTSAADLRRVLESGAAARLPGFGERKARQLLEALEQVERQGDRIPLGYALPVAEALAAELEKLPGVERVAVAGDLRRGRETVAGVELVAAAEDAEGVADAVAALPPVEEVLARDPAKVSVRVEGGLRVELRIVPPDAFVPALHHATGSAAHIARLRQRARQLGLEVDERGIYRRSADGGAEEFLPVPDEAALYRHLGLGYIPPELREDRGEIEAAERGRLPRLVETADLRGDLHVHSRWSDGAASIREMAEAARARGYRYLAICDHSRSLRVAHGLEIEDLRAQWREIEELNRHYAEAGIPFRILRGAEVDILKDGGLDYPDEILAELDIVVASVHSHLRLDRAAMTERLLAAMENPHVDVIGHPTGRRLGIRDAYEVDLDAVIEAASRSGTVLEINASPERLDLGEEAARKAAERGVMLCIDTDAHAPGQLAQVVLGVTVARRAWLEPAHILNALDLPDLEAWLRLPKGERARRGPGSVGKSGDSPPPGR
ncbi:MAG: histidinol-phosphatase, partial [Bacillota bacterium]